MNTSKLRMWLIGVLYLVPASLAPLIPSLAAGKKLGIYELIACISAFCLSLRGYLDRTPAQVEGTFMPPPETSGAAPVI